MNLAILKQKARLITTGATLMVALTGVLTAYGQGSFDLTNCTSCHRADRQLESAGTRHGGQTQTIISRVDDAEARDLAALVKPLLKDLPAPATMTTTQVQTNAGLTPNE